MKIEKAFLFIASIFGASIITSCQSQSGIRTQPTVVVTVQVRPPPLTAPMAQFNPNDPWPYLRQHALELQPPPPELANEDCPRGQASIVNPAFGEAIGAGPAYAVGLGLDATLNFVKPATNNQFAGSDWGGQKVLWVVSPAYPGPILIRGHQVNGPDEIRFDAGINPPNELHIEASLNSDWRSQPSFTRLRAAGCYEYQVDGLGFSEWITFKAIESNQ